MRIWAFNEGALGVACVAAALAATPAAAASARVAVFDVRFFDTSNEPVDQTADHARRAEAATRQLRERLSEGGAVEAVAPKLDACSEETPECVFARARGAGAGKALTVVVHKSSSLIVQAWLRLVDLETNRVVVSRDVNFRGDSDESWRRAFGFLARETREAMRRAHGD